MLGLLTLPEEIQLDIQSKEISMAHARILSKLENKEQQKSLVERIKKEKISVHELEDLTSNEQYKRKNKVTKTNKNNEYKYLEEELNEKLGTKVKIKNNKLEIYFANTNDLNRILEIMNLESDN
jgi:ParB family chromosome partitioning protein